MNRNSKPEGRSPSIGGFSLLELLVAVSVAGILLVVLLSGFGRSIKSTGLAEDYTLASFLAREAISSLECRTDLKPGTLEDDFGEEFPRFAWRAEISEHPKYPTLAATLTVLIHRNGTERAVDYRLLLTPPQLTGDRP